jgi:pilus assembly protein Flp/PilA
LRQIVAVVAAWLSTAADRSRDDGATATEYAVLMGFIAVIVAAGVGIFGAGLDAVYTSIVAAVVRSLSIVV